MIIKKILKDWGLEVLILSFFIVVIVPFGAGITFDSVSFFQSGDNFWKSGQYVHFAADGQMEFAAHRFPLYPLIVSLFRNIDPDLLALQIILFIALIAAFRFFLRDLKSPRYFLLLLATYPIFLNYYAIWTEGLYAVLFVCLLIRLHKEQEYQKAFWIIAIVVLLCLTKMVGIVVAGSLLLAYVIDKRPLRGLMFFVIAAAVISTWIMIGSFQLGHTARSFGYIGFDSWNLFFLAIELGAWFTPTPEFQYLPMTIGIVMVLTPLFFMIRAWKNRRELGVLFWFLNIHFFSYLIFIVFCRSFLDASIAYDLRTLFPLLINFIGILVLMQNLSVLNEKARSKIRYIFPKLIVLIVAINVVPNWMLRENGLGYNSKEWKEFEFIGELQNLKTDRVYTNDQAAIYLYAPQVEEIVLLPEKMNLYSRQLNPAYTAEMDLLEDEIQGYFETSLVVWIRNGVTEDAYPSYEELRNNGFYKVIYDDWLCLILRKKFKGEFDPFEI